MTKSNITQYDNTAANNTDVEDVPLGENLMYPAHVNNAFREIMADLADINDGTVALTSPSFATASLTGNLTFGDSDKAIFGAGSDLQIYHDGSNSYISESGTGNLLIDATDLRLRSGSGEIFLKATQNGAVELRHDNSAKLATTSTGIDVTGTVTADGITSDGAGKSYTWRALNNTGNSSTRYTKIARVVAGQSSRFIIEIAGRSTSYSSPNKSAMGYIVGQLNSDNNYDMVFYNHSGEDTVVDEVGHVDVNSTTADIYIKTGSYSEVTAHGHISDGTITVDSTSNGSTEPSNYIAATEIEVWNSANDGSGSGLDADTVDGIQASSFLRSDASDTTSGNLTVTGGELIVDKVRCNTGQQLVLNAGEANSQATGQTGELVYMNAEGGVQINSSTDNWATWTNRRTTTITGTRITVDGNYWEADDNNWNKFYTTSGYIQLGPANASYAHIYTDRPSFYFNKSNLYANSTSNLIWHAGNDGSGSGLDADTLDGVQGSSYLRSDATDTTTGYFSVDNHFRVINNGVSGQGDNNTHFNYNDTGINYIRGTDTIFSSPTEYLNELHAKATIDMCSDDNDAARYIHMARGGGITFYGDDSVSHSITSRNLSGTVTDDLTISSYGAVYIKLDANNNNTSNADFVITQNGSTSQLFKVNGENGATDITNKLTLKHHSNSASSPTIALKDSSSDTSYNTGIYTPTVNLGDGIGFTCGGNEVLQCRRGYGNPWVVAGDDNNTNLGISSRRWKQLYAGTTTISTSDENQKQQIATLTDAEITAATAISKLFRTYKWNDAVEEKGDNARTHTGVIAQQVKQAMTDAGLDATKYAFFCSDTWWTDTVVVDPVEAQDGVYDDDGSVITEPVEEVAGHTYTVDYFDEDEAPDSATKYTMLGIRYPDLLSFVAAATEQRLANIETRLAALEAAD